MRNPRTAAGAHDGLEGRDKSARGNLQLDVVSDPVVDVGFAIGHDENLGVRQLVAEQEMQGPRRPLHFDALDGLLCRLEIAKQLPQVCVQGRRGTALHLRHDAAARLADSLANCLQPAPQ